MTDAAPASGAAPAAANAPAANAAPAAAAANTAPAQITLAPTGGATAPVAGPGVAAGNVADVVVTARLQQEKIEDVPIPVTAVGGAALDREHAKNVQDFAQKVPNLGVSNGNARQMSIAIRGIGKNSGNESMEGSVGVIVDGVFMTQPGQTWGDYVDLDHIEVLRGPQGTLLGKNTTMGVVNIVTKPPSFTPENEIELSYGNRNFFVAKASSTGTLIPNLLAYRITGFYDYQDGFLENQAFIGGKWQDATDRWGGRAQFLYTPNADWKTRVIVDHAQSIDYNNTSAEMKEDPQRYSNGTPRPATFSSRLARFGYTPILGSWDIADFNTARASSTSQDGVSVTTDWDRKDFTITSISAARAYMFDPQNDGDHTGLDISRNPAGVHVDTQQYSQELRFASNPNPNRLIDWQFGFYALRSEAQTLSRNEYGVDAGKFYASNAQYAATSAAALRDALNGVRVFTEIDPATTSLAAYTQETIHVTKQAALTLGIRDSYEEKTNWTQKWRTGGVDLASLYSGADLTNATAIRNSQTALYTLGTDVLDGESIKANSLSWLVNPSYKINDDILTYFSWGKGEKSGAVQFNTTTGAPQNVKPETTQDFEVGFRTSWLDHKLTINPNLFYQTIENYQQTIAAPDTRPGRTGQYVSQLGNVPEVRVRGVEIDGSWQPPVEGLRINFAGSYNDAIYVSHPNAPNSADNSAGASGTTDLSGRGLSNAPKWIGYVGFDYTAPLPQNTLGVDWQGGLSWYAFGSQTFRSRTNLDGILSSWGEQSDYGLTNAGIGVKRDDGKWDFSLWAKNLFDVQYYVALTPATSTAATQGTAGSPLTVGFTFRTKW